MGMSVRGAIWGRWWYISDGPRWEMKEVNFLSSLLLFKAIWVCTDSEDLLQHLNWVFPVTRLLSLKKGNVFNRLSPRAFRGQLLFILLACQSAKGTDIWFLLLRRSVVTNEWAWHLNWSCTLSKHRTPWHFSYYKVVKFGNLTPFQSNIFLAILGYREICQCHSW